jgi:hypothetical protein
MTKRTSRNHLKCLTLHYNALLSACSVILADVFFPVILVIIKGAIVSLNAPKKSPERPREPIVPTGTPNRPQMYLFCSRKDAEVPDLNAKELCNTRGLSGLFHTKSMFLGQKKYIFEWFGGNMGTINTSAQSGVPRVRLNVSTRLPTEVRAFWSGRWIDGF